MVPNILIWIFFSLINSTSKSDQLELWVSVCMIGQNIVLTFSAGINLTPIVHIFNQDGNIRSDVNQFKTGFRMNGLIIYFYLFNNQ